jgi:[ribosomal protein S18]-alanine N-acetyltransferase
MHTRWFIRRDIPEIVEIEKELGYEPWNENDIIAFTRERCAIGVIIEDAGKIVGYIFYYVYPKSIDIVRVGVCAGKKGIGAGRELINRLKRKPKQFMTVFVPESLLDLQLFFKKMGFRAIKVINSPECEPKIRFIYRNEGKNKDFGRIFEAVGE